ncbi:MAG: hemerythrin domain-containing protein [Candidatus Binataceae bacterium]
MNPEFRIEISDLGEAKQRQEIFFGFDRLAASQTLELILNASADLECFLAEFQDRYGQGFDWWPLGNRSHASSVLIAKRTTEPRTISAFLGNDHHRLTERWDGFVEAVKVCEQSYENLFTAEKGHRMSTIDGLSQFIFGLRRHIRMEEEYFFPLFEDRSRTPPGSGPTAVMRAEHQEIEAVLRELDKLFDGGDCANIIQAIEVRPVHPSELFHNHDAKEEAMLYPMADRLFTQKEKDDLCLKMQTV